LASPEPLQISIKEKAKAKIPIIAINQDKIA
jgi:hypothetical protein